MYLTELKCSNHDLALAEIEAVGGVKETARGIAITTGLRVEEGLGMTHRILRYKARSDADPESVLTAVKACDFDFEGTFRVRSKGIENHEVPGGTEHIEREVGEVIYERNNPVDLDDPDHEFRLIYTEGNCYFGRLLYETESGFGDRDPTKKPFFKPATMAPDLSRALTNIAGGFDDAVLLDPMCGTGGFLVEAALQDAYVVGFDSQREMIEGSRMNLEEYSSDSERFLGVGDATSLPLSDNSVDGVATDLPYGRASKVDAETLDELNRDVFSELARVVKDDGKVVAVSNTWLDDEAEDAGLETLDRIDERVHRSLTRRIHVMKV